MYRFIYENQGSDKYLIYQLEQKEKLDTMALGMLNHNKIPNLLPVSFTQIDSERYLRYSSLPQSTLKGQLAGMMTKERLLMIFDGICEGVRSSEEYLLDGNAFVLEAENIYVDPASGKTSLVYLPILDTGIHTDYVSFFKGIITNMIADRSEDLSYVTTILYFLNSTENFSLNEFSKLVKSLRQTPTVLSERKEIRQEVKKVLEKPAKPEQPKAPIVKETEKAVIHKEPEVKETKNVQQISENKKSVKMPKAGYEFEIPGKDIGKKTVVDQEVTEKDEEDGKMSMLYLLRNFSGENLEKYKEQKGEKNDKKKEEKQKGGKKTPVLTLVSMDMARPYTFAVTKNKYKIGRKDTNDAVIKDIGSVSREHCMIVRKGNEYYVEDVGSTYGTIVDGVECIPGQRNCILHEQSVIEFKEISFRVEFR